MNFTHASRTLSLPMSTDDISETLTSKPIIDYKRTNETSLIIDTPLSNNTSISAKAIHPYHLGASLYMPATRGDIWQVISRVKLPQLNSVIICLEDAVSESDVPFALDNLQQILDRWYADASLSTSSYAHSLRPLVFVRPRNPQMMQELLDMPHIDLVDGYVLPKIDMDTLSDWRVACQEINKNSLLMPTLETGRLFDSSHNKELVNALGHAFDERIFALRIGGNDLFATIRQRRPNNTTIYETPVGLLIHQLIGIFAVAGYYLSAPVFEYFDRTALFMQELSQDVSFGLVGKTVIHPSQIPLVQQAFCVPSSMLEEAKAILDSEAKAVFKHNNTMLEPATHHAWAVEVLQRAKVFGVLGNEPL